MQDIDPIKRRASDALPPPSSDPVLSLLKELLDRVAHIERKQEEHCTAYPVNDLHKPDFDGHRRDHIHRIKASEVMDNYKQSATKSVLGWLVIFIAGLTAAGAMTFLKDHLK